MDKALARIKEQDQALAAVAKKVKVLTALSWPAEVEDRFLEGVERGQPALPEVALAPPDLSGVRDGLTRIAGDLDQGHPLGAFLWRTARSHLRAAEMLASVGKPRFTELSKEIYGRPSDLIHEGAPSHMEAAESLLALTDGFDSPEPAELLDAETVAQRLQEQIGQHFPADDPLPVELHDNLSGKATAGSTRVRIRRGACFSEAGVGQLLHHEALVHSATKRNGRSQPLLSSMGLSSPRTTCAQEGLATLAELVTHTIDLARLRRIALRVRAVQAALDGADFIQVYGIFREAGQGGSESFHSARRVFRGGDVRGAVAFTKDVIYLKGLATVHTFLRKAIAQGRHSLPRILFAGRMTLGDALALEPLFEAGVLEMPRVLPAWVREEECLAAVLAWGVYSNSIRLERVELEDIDDEA
ncbi:MAG: DUF1704 domain-containing protein [Alphaproteobacteria bacterium]|nr:DUF1704 domain-containing protein [Alphaproteobacteria bacterium]